MAKLKDIKGSAIQYLEEDPIEYVGSWSAGGNLNSARRGMGGAGTVNTAMLAYGGDAPPFSALNEEYNGSSWTEVADLNTARQFLGDGGTRSAAIAYGGRNILVIQVKKLTIQKLGMQPLGQKLII